MHYKIPSLPFRKLIIFGFLSFYFIFTSKSQSIYEQIGRLPITAYNAEEYHGNPVVWNTLQSEDGLMYFGTSTGILEYDGVSWRSLFKRNQNISVYSLTKDDKGRIFYSGRDFGYLKTNEKEGTKAVSLLHLLPKEIQDGFIAWEIHFWKGAFLIRIGFERIVKLELTDDLKLKSLKSWEPETSFGISFVVDNEYYVRQAGKGLYRPDGEDLKLIPNTEFFGSIGLTVMLPYKEGTGKSLLLGGQTTGFYLFDGYQISKFPSGIDQELKNGVLLRHAIRHEENYILALIGGGIVVMSPKGEILKRIGRDQGLPSNIVSRAFLDQNQGLWATTDDGMARIVLDSPILIFGKELEINSSIFNIYKKGDELLIGTTTGLIRFDQKKKNFQPFPGIGPGAVYNFLFDGEDLIIPGLEFQLFRKGKTIRIDWPNKDGDSRQVLIPKNHPDFLLVGATNGLFVYRRSLSKESLWEYQGKVPDIGPIEFDLMEGSDGTVFLTGRGKLYALDLRDWSLGPRDPGRIITNILEFNPSEDLFSLVDGEFYTFSSKGFQKYSSREKRLIPTGEFSKVEKDLFDFYQGKTGILWYESMNGKRYILKRDGTNKFTPENTPNSVSPFFSSVEFLDEDSVMWFGSANVLVRYDPKKDNQSEKKFFTLIRRIETKADTLSLLAYGRDKTLAPMKIKENSFRFDFAAPYFEEEKKTKYQTFLDGFDPDWTDWNDNRFKEYTNLSPGTYTFRVRALAHTGNVSEEATFAFVVLPPRYATWWAYLMYALLLGGIVTTIVKWRSGKLKKQNIILEERVNERTAALEKSLTELKSTQAQLIHSEKMASLGELTAGIAHEIQNPLNFVNNFSELNKDLIEEIEEERAKSQESRDETLISEILKDLKDNETKINHHGKRAESIVKGMLAHSRTSSGEKALTDINALVDEYLRLSYHGLRAKDKSFLSDFKADLDPNLPKVNVVPQEIGRVLLNLINNAFQACSERKEQLPQSSELWENFRPLVTVSTKNLGNKILISVSDNGQGIPEAIKDKIFQPFFTTKPTGQGTGLGLSLSYDIVKSHGGEIIVDSIEGEGTTITVKLPI